MSIENISQTHNSITEHLINLTRVANQNLKLLNTLNASLFTNSTSLEVNYNDENFYVPSFIFLETRISEIEENLKRIADIPKSGSAGVLFPKDGSMERIITLGFDNAPERIDSLNTPETFNFENNYFFKDFITPNVYIAFDLSDKIEKNIKEINVKKIILSEGLFNNLYPLTTDEINNKNRILSLQLKNQVLSEEDKLTLKNINDKLSSISYGDIKSKLYLLKENVDYKEFDKTYILPYKNNKAYGDFKILTVDANLVDVKTARNITASVKIDTFNYYIDNGAITNTLSIGNKLITSDDKSIWKVVNLNNNTNEVKIELESGYTTLKETNDYPEYYFKFYEDNDIYKSTLKVSLEEDKYILIFISPINSELNILAPWSNAIFVNVDELTNGELTFRDFYNKNVKNLGDILQGIMNEISYPLYMFSKETFNKISNTKPEINTDNLKVVSINEHLNDAANIEDLKRLHTQKSELNNQLTVLQNDLDNIQDILASTSFDNTTELNRQGYENKYTSLLAQKRLITQELIKIINEISTKASSNVIPLDKAKYRIRGYISNNPLSIYKDINSTQYDTTFENIEIIKWYTEYRYKNAISDNVKSTSIGDDNYIYSSWNIMNSPVRKKIPTWNSNINEYEYKYETPALSENNPSYLQVDIPIQQGEIVEIRTTAILNIGYPFVNVQTLTSPAISIDFPDELRVNVDIIDIVNQNNDDAQSAQFMNILINDGYQAHIDNKIIDQDKTFFHKPEEIASGYYTDERRIIPLKDKLSELVNQLNSLQKTVIGNQNNILNISISDGIVNQKMLPNTPLDFYVESYTKAMNNYPNTVAPIVTQKLLFNITNPTDAAISIYSLLPGANSIPLGQLSYGSDLLKYYKEFPIFIGDKWRTQNLGQFLYFRSINPFTLDSYFYNASIKDGMNSFFYDSETIKDYIQDTDSNFKVLVENGAPATLPATTIPVAIKSLKSTLYNNLDYLFTNNHPIVNLYNGSPKDEWPIMNSIDLRELYSQSKFLSVDNVQWSNIDEYDKDNNIFKNYKGSFNEAGDIYTKGKNSIGAYLYPYIMDTSVLSVGSGIENAARVIQPKETISIPVYFQYRLTDGSLTDIMTKSIQKIEKTIAFDIRTSLFKDPEIYIAKIVATLNSTTNQEQLRRGNNYSEDYTPSTVI